MADAAAAAARHTQNLVYDHPSSKQQRAKAAAESRAGSDPIVKLRLQQREEAGALGEKHRAAGGALDAKHRRQRSQDVYIANGAVPDHTRLAREAEERRDLHKRHAGERTKMLERHEKEMSAARDKHKGWAE